MEHIETYLQVCITDLHQETDTFKSGKIDNGIMLHKNGRCPLAFKHFSK